MLHEKRMDFEEMEFKLIFTGIRSYHQCDDECVVDMGCLLYSSVVCNKFGTIIDALLFTEETVRQSSYIELEKNCDKIQHDEEYFIAQQVMIKDRLGRSIINGLIDNQTIHWIKPVLGDVSIEKIHFSMRELREKASFEAGWDNYSAAKKLRGIAEEMSLSLIDSHYFSMLEDLIDDSRNSSKNCFFSLKYS
ncbi:MAG: hypothetical protein H0U75_11740 [Legionella sp.]|nr:hypothetical protein [Legionella sp.]